MSAHVLEQLSGYLDDELVPADRSAIESHLRECAACAKQLEELAAVDSLARALPAEAPEGYFTDFAARVRGRVEVKPARRAPARLPAWVLAAAAAVALGVTVPALVRRQDLAPPAPALEVRDAMRVEPSAAAPTDGPAEAERPLAAPEAPAPPPPVEEAKSQKRLQAPPAPRAKAALPQEEYAEPHGLDGGVAESVDSAPLQELTRAVPEADALKKRDQVEQPRATGALSAENQAKSEYSGYASAPAAAPMTQAAAESRREKSAPDDASKLALAGAGRKDAGAPGARSDRGRFGQLLDRVAATAAEARALREAWRVHGNLAAGGEADEARVRVLEAGAQAYRLGRDGADLALLEKDTAAYLARPDALQASRARAALLSVRGERP